jgi:hypothetical protein
VSAEARRRAERCFALASSTTFEGERANAVARGIAIAEAAGLDLAEFDIPGRARATPRQPTTADLFGSRSDFEDAFRSFEEALRRRGRPSAAEAFYGRGFGETFADAVHREQERRREADPNLSGAAMNRLRADLAISFLWASDLKVYPWSNDGRSRVWIIPDESDLKYDDEGVVEVANRYGWLGGATFKDGKPQPDKSARSEVASARDFLSRYGLSDPPLDQWTDEDCLSVARAHGWRM